MVINDETVNRIIHYLRERGLCQSSIHSHEKCYADFQAFLAENQCDWNDSSVRLWADGLKAKHGHNLSRIWFQYLYQLREFCETGSIADRHFFLNRSAYDNLDGSFKSELDKYLESCRTAYTARSWLLARNYLSEALLFFTDMGKTSVKELTYQDLKSFIQHDFNCSAKNRAVILGHLRQMFGFMSKQGKCPEGFHLCKW